MMTYFQLQFQANGWFPKPRWQFCVGNLKEHMPLVLSRWYITDYVESEDAVVEDVSDM